MKGLLSTFLQALTKQLYFYRSFKIIEIVTQTFVSKIVPGRSKSQLDFISHSSRFQFYSEYLTSALCRFPLPPTLAVPSFVLECYIWEDNHDSLVFSTCVLNGSNCFHVSVQNKSLSGPEILQTSVPGLLSSSRSPSGSPR